MCPSPFGLPPTYPIPLLSVITEHQFKFPGSHIPFPLAVYFTRGEYMFPCYCFNSSHPLLPALCPQSFSLCLCLHCFPANSFISTIFLDSVFCVNIWYLFFWFTSICIVDSSSSTLSELTQMVPFYGWVIFHCVYVPQLLYPCISQWTHRLLACPSYCK